MIAEGVKRVVFAVGLLAAASALYPATLIRAEEPSPGAVQARASVLMSVVAPSHKFDPAKLLAKFAGRLVTPVLLGRPILKRRVRFASPARPVLRLAIRSASTFHTVFKGESPGLRHLEVIGAPESRSCRFQTTVKLEEETASGPDTLTPDAPPPSFLGLTCASPRSLAPPVLRRRIFKKT